MRCQTCVGLLAAYRHAVTHLRKVVEEGSGAAGEDFRLASEEATRLCQQCRQVRSVLLAHWRKDHETLAAKAGN
jgi:Zn finger protein HypA/HybF involved in hydrogenase expression